MPYIVAGSDKILCLLSCASHLILPKKAIAGVFTRPRGGYFFWRLRRVRDSALNQPAFKPLLLFDGCLDIVYQLPNFLKFCDKFGIALDWKIFGIISQVDGSFFQALCISIRLTS